jgi:predicted nucleic acid-binding protein
MPAYYFDTSALVKRYIAVTGYVWIVGLCDPAVANELFIAQISEVEVVATFCRMMRERPRRLTIRSRDRTIDDFRDDLKHQYTITPITSTICARAADLCRSHPLRAYDAVQLACALAVCDAAVAAGAAPPTFVCADVTLAGAAAERLAADDPNAHP